MIIASLVVIVLALFYIFAGSSGGRSRSPGSVYFYDSGTGELFSAPRESTPPIVGPSGEEAWMAYVFTCGSCSKKERFIAFLEKFPPDVKARMAELEARADAEDLSDLEMDEFYALGEQLLISRLDPIEWVNHASDEAQAILEEARAKCPTGEFKICRP